MLYVQQSPLPPWFLTKNCLRDSEKKEIILKYFDFFEYIFILNLLNGEKRCLPYLSEQESTINAGEFLFQVCFTQHILCILRTILIYTRQHASMFVLFDNDIVFFLLSIVFLLLSSFCFAEGCCIF